MTNSNRYIAVSILILVCALTTLCLIDSYGKRSRIIGPAGTVDSPLVNKKVVMTAQDAHTEWKRNGVKGRTVLFAVDGWDRLDIADTPPIPMSRPYPIKLYSIPEWYDHQAISQANILFVASMNSIIRRAIVILSPEGYDERLAVGQKSKDRKIGNGVMYLPHQAFPRWFTTIQNFRGEREPVLMYVGASFFKSTEPEVLFHKLKEMKLETDSIILCLMVGDNRVTRVEREKLLRFAQLAGITPLPLAVLHAADAIALPR